MSLFSTLLTALVASGPATPPAAATQVVVQKGETLAQVARRTLGDPKAAAELRALNGLPNDTVAAGTTLKLPGAERDRAFGALAAARDAVLADSSAKAKAERKEALGRLTLAEALFARAQYSEAAAEADKAWRLVSDNAKKGSNFSVEVSESGKTKVRAREGHPVHVEAQGVARQVYAGQQVAVEKGHPPPPPDVPPSRPELRAPEQAAVLRIKPTREGLGPVVLAWQPVQGATTYTVELFGDGRPEAHVRLTANAPTASLPPLRAGRYRWSVRAHGKEGLTSEASERRFELVEDPLKLEVREAGWK